MHLLAALGEALLGVGVLQQAERVAPLDDGEHVELAGLAHEVGHGGVPGLVGGHAVALVGRVDVSSVTPSSTSILASATSDMVMAERPWVSAMTSDSSISRSRAAGE